MLVREAREADARAIAAGIAMAESEMVHHFTGTTDPEQSSEALMRFVLSPVENRYSLNNNLVADVDGKAVGSIISFPADRQPELDIPMLEDMNRRGYGLEKLFFEGEPGTYYLSTMGIDSAYRGRGIGTALMAAAQEKGRRMGYALASLLVSKEKPKAKTLYERVGFRVLSEVTIVDVAYCRMVREL